MVYWGIYATNWADARQEAQLNEQQAILSEKLKNLQQFLKKKQAAKTKSRTTTDAATQEAGMTGNDAGIDCPSRSNNRSLRRNQNL